MGKSTPLSSSLLSFTKPILASQYDRFGPKCLHDTLIQNDIPHESVQIHTRSCTTDSNLPSQPLTQKKLIHPEGGFIHGNGRLVSEDPLSVILQRAGDAIVDQCSEFGYSDVTVFLRMRESALEYYVADHSGETIVWLDNQRPDRLRNLAEPRIKNMLSEEYWAHMEAIPGSRYVGTSNVTRLKSVLCSLAIDSATSDGSTSPFSYDQIKDFLKLLNGFREEHVDEYQTYAVARIWNMVWHARAINNFGSSNACLDRFIPLSDNPPTFTGFNALLALATLGAADRNLGRCSRAWAGRIAYVGEWRQFKTKNETEWQQVIQLACAMVIASLLLFEDSTSGVFSSLPTLLSLGAAACGYYLITESQNLGNHAADASVYFQTWEKPEYNVQRIALRNAMPQALLGWAFISLVGVILRFL